MISLHIVFEASEKLQTKSNFKENGLRFTSTDPVNSRDKNTIITNKDRCTETRKYIKSHALPRQLLYMYV